MHRQRQRRADGGNETDDNLHLPHERKHPALVSIHGQSGVHPRLRTALHPQAAERARLLQLLNGPLRTVAGLAEDIERRARTLSFTAERGGIQLVERDESRAGDVGVGVLARRAHVEELGGLASGQAPLQLAWADVFFGLRCVKNHGMII